MTPKPAEPERLGPTSTPHAPTTLDEQHIFQTSSMGAQRIVLPCADENTGRMEEHAILEIYVLRLMEPIEKQENATI